MKKYVSLNPADTKNIHKILYVGNCQNLKFYMK